MRGCERPQAGASGTRGEHAGSEIQLRRCKPERVCRAVAAGLGHAETGGGAASPSVIIAGDSIPEDLGPMITRTLNGPLFSGHTEYHPSTGLVRDDYYDWPAAARRIAAEHPDTVIMLLGGNDDQPITLPGSGAHLQPATPAWDAEYARRAGLVMDALLGGGVHRVYWLTMPTTDLPGMNVAVAAMGQAIRAAAPAAPPSPSTAATSCSAPTPAPA